MPSHVAAAAAATTAAVPATTATTKPNAAHALRLCCRAKTHTTPTAGLAPGHIQANLLVLPTEYAQSFVALCARNPVPCPLLARTRAGSFSDLVPLPPFQRLTVSPADLDLRHDLPSYNVYRGGRLVSAGQKDIAEEWGDRHVGFLIGCSFSFEAALVREGLAPRHVEAGCNVAMYRTRHRLNPAGVFADPGSYVVSMRPYKEELVERVRRVTARYAGMHGEPLAWGWAAVAELGIADIERPEFGDPVEVREGEVPVFWVSLSFLLPPSTRGG
jgi:uncharacterized protein YcsI (UPF0317 family)